MPQFANEAAMKCGNWSLGYLWSSCKSATLSLEFDIELFLTTGWLNNCVRKPRCHLPRTESLKVTAFIPRALPTTPSWYAPIRAIIGSATGYFTPQPRNLCAVILEIPSWLNALRVVITQAFFTFVLASVIRRPTEFWRQRTSQFRSPPTPRLRRCGSLGVPTEEIGPLFRPIADGLNVCCGAVNKELSRMQGVWKSPNYQVGLLVP